MWKYNRILPCVFTGKPSFQLLSNLFPFSKHTKNRTFHSLFPWCSCTSDVISHEGRYCCETSLLKCYSRTSVLKQMLWTFTVGKYGHKLHRVTVLGMTWHWNEPAVREILPIFLLLINIIVLEIAANYLISEFHYRIMRTKNG